MKKLMIPMLALSLLAVACDDKKPAEDPSSTPATNSAPTPDKPATNNDAPATNNDEPTTETTGAAAPATDGTDIASIDPATLNEQAPPQFSVKFETTEGDFTVDLVRDWAPKGVDRFYNLVKAGYYTDIAAFRVIDGFMAQFGIHGNPAVNAKWREAKIQDDPRNKEISNKEGYLTYAMGGPHTRTVQLFINYKDNSMLDNQGFTPIGKVAGDGMNVVNSWHKGYGEGAPRGKGPDQMKVQMQGNAYLKRDFPELSYIKSITLLGDPSTGTAAAPDKPEAKKKAWEPGAYTQSDIAQADIEGGQVKMSVKEDGTVNGRFQGKREGKGFSISFKGSMADNGQLVAQGTKGQNQIRLTGRYNDGGIHGNVQGSINAKGLRVSFKAMK